MMPVAPPWPLGPLAPWPLGPLAPWPLGPQVKCVGGQVVHIFHLCKANGWVRPAVYQGLYNAIARGAEAEVPPPHPATTPTAT